MMLMIVFGFLIPSPAMAALSIKPGLWSVQMKMSQNGKAFELQSKMNEAMAKMNPEQRKKMEAMMSKMSGGEKGQLKGMMGLSDKGFQVCYTAESLKREEALHQSMDQKCEARFPVKTPEHLVAEFKCKNGMTGKANWKVIDSTHYEGSVVMERGAGEEATVQYQGSFISPDCGKIKPKN